MALANAQMNVILKRYDDTRLKNYHIQEGRRERVYATVVGYKELDDSTVSVSMDIARKKLAGEKTGSDDLHALLTDLRNMKRSLLKGAGLPEDYLEPIYDCPDCKDTGYINNSKKCHCLKQQIIEMAYSQSNIIDLINTNNFSTLSYDYYKGADLENFKRGVSICHDMVDNFDKVHKNILFYGSVGTGKSFLSGCVAKELIESGHSVIYFSSISFFKALAHETFENKSKDDLYNLYDYIYNCDCLIIDDLGTEVTNSFVSTQLFACINERALRGLSTIISTNLTLSELRDRYSERVFSRIASGYEVCRLSGPDIRLLRKTNM